jgi:hypothetical protein
MTSLSGLFVGIASPSRDMLVRAVTPPRRLRTRLRIRVLRLQHRLHDCAD